MSEIIQCLKKVDEFVRSIDGVPYSFRTPIDEWISERNKWILYAAPQCETKAQAISAPLPNVWIGSSSADKSDLNGNRLSMGLSYQTKPLVETFMQLDAIPNRRTRDTFLTIISKVSNAWEFTIHKKTRWDTFASSPDYETLESTPCSQINSQKLTEILALLRKIKSESLARNAIIDGRRIDYQGPSFNLMEASVDFPSPDFGIYVREIFGIFQMCLQLKDSSTTNREIEIMKKDIQILKTKLHEIEKAIKWNRFGQNSKAKMMVLAQSYIEELQSYPKDLTD